MTDKIFTEFLRGANEALAHAQGRRNLYMTTLPFPRESVNGRRRYTPAAGAPCSQAAFSLNIGPWRRAHETVPARCC